MTTVRSGNADIREAFEVMDLTAVARRFKLCTAARWGGIQQHRRLFTVDEDHSKIIIDRRGRRLHHRQEFSFTAAKRLCALLDGIKHPIKEIFGTLDPASLRQALWRLRQAIGDRRIKGGGYEIIHADGEYIWFELPKGEHGFWRRRTVGRISLAPTKRRLVKAVKSLPLDVEEGLYRWAFGFAAAAFRLYNSTPYNLLQASDFLLEFRGKEFYRSEEVELIRSLYPNRRWLPLDADVQAPRRGSSERFWCAFDVPGKPMFRGLRVLKGQARVVGLSSTGRRLLSNTFDLLIHHD